MVDISAGNMNDIDLAVNHEISHRASPLHPLTPCDLACSPQVGTGDRNNLATDMADCFDVRGYDASSTRDSDSKHLDLPLGVRWLTFVCRTIQHMYGAARLS